MTSFRDLALWQLSMELVLDIYKTTREFPDSEKFGIVSRCEGRRFPYHPTLQRVLGGAMPRNSFNSCILPKVRWLNLRPSWRYLTSYNT